jgi:hypothetical protein
VGCSGTFAYLFVRKVTGQASTANAAEAAARKSVVQTLTNEVDQHPCPTCGLYQPDMIGAQRARRHWLLFWALLISLGVLMILYATDLVAANLLIWIATAACGLAAVGHFLINLNNPNRNLEANHQMAQARLQSGVLQLGKAGSSEPPAPEVREPRWALGHRLVYVLLAVTVLAVPVCEWLRLASGWPLNPDWHPPVAGPGDETYLWLPTKISSVKGYWNAAATVEATRADEPNVSIPVQASSKNASWGNSISAKSSEKDSSSTLWISLRLPPGQDLAGKVLNLKLNLAVTYPKASPDGTRFDTRQQTVSETASLRLAAPKAGALYTRMWWMGILGGGGFGLIVALYLISTANAGKKQALPTSIYAPQ